METDTGNQAEREPKGVKACEGGWRVTCRLFNDTLGTVRIVEGQVLLQ